MKKNIWMVLAAASLMTACDYNEKYFAYRTREIWKACCIPVE
mgnify:FL=1